MPEDCTSAGNCIENINNEMSFGRKITKPSYKAIH